VGNGRRARTAALAQRLQAMRSRSETAPGMPVVLEALRRERELGGGLIAGGLAFRLFLWLVPFGLVVAALLSFWSTFDPDGLERAARRFGIGAAAAQAASEALDHGERSAVTILVVGLVLLAWFTLGAVRALVLASALAWRLEPPRLRRPFAAIAIFNGLFLLELGATSGVAWLLEQVGRAGLLGILGTTAVTTAIALYGMWLLPHAVASPRELLPGALVVAVGVQLLHVAVLVYFAPRLGRAEETYGAFGTAATILVWLYLLARLVTAAGFVNATLAARRQPAPSRGSAG
jgi:uncharacterized BrkB/YihY/UPF0761 family membrane protein